MKLDIVVLWITFTIDRLSKMRKLTCHCGLVEIEIDIKDSFEDLYRCNCSMCIRKGAITAIVNKEDLKVEEDDQSSALGSIGLKPKIVH